MDAVRFVILGAGSIGCYVGGHLRAAGYPVHFIGRQRTATALSQNGLSIETLDGRVSHVPSEQVEFSEELNELNDGVVVLVCVKNQHTERAARQLAASLKSRSTIVSLQNGLDNAETLSAALPDHEVLAGMVAFNVINPQDGTYKATTEGDIYIENGGNAPAIAAALNAAGLTAHVSDAIQSIQWSKLILNLNNGLNALSGLPLAQQLRDRNWRKLLALCMSEAIKVAQRENVSLVAVGKAKPQIIPWILRLPNFLFERIAAQMLRIDPAARSSMADDLVLGRGSEIDFLNGKIVDLSRKHGLPSPANTLVVNRVKKAFDQGQAGRTDPRDLLAELG
ncbi:MAG: 2-dehydropantoate 2-reductase [Pseudomonadota bacterium]